MQKNIVHADLALRNILVGYRSDGEARYHGKVGDFGLSKIITRGNYYKSSTSVNGRIPYRWSAPEVEFCIVCSGV